MTRLASPIAFLFVAAACAACGGAPAPATASAPPSAPSTAAAADDTPASVPTAWSADLTNKQKALFMKSAVVPRMIKVFQGQDAQRYAEFGCKTCHGPEFKDPKEFLPKLTVKDGKLTAFAEKPDIAKFMSEKVVPEMATAMGMPPYDPATKKGFGCGGCHPMQMN